MKKILLDVIFFDLVVPGVFVYHRGREREDTQNILADISVCSGAVQSPGRFNCHLGD